jgi:acyl-CoA synthetase (AMP-forming)/AMP-acid ligase II/acyl carrier protein
VLADFQVGLLGIPLLLERSHIFQTLDMVNQTTLGQPAAIATLVELLDRRVQETPEGLAYRFLNDGTPDSAETITYRELQRQARAIAVLLTDLQCQGERVLLLYPSGLAYIAAFLGCLYAGATAVPAYPPRPNRSLERIQAIIQDARAKVALTDGGTLEKLQRRLAESPVLKALYWLSTDGLQLDLAEQWQPPTIGSDTLALLQYTSGSTALPKGVMISHGNLLHNSELIRQCFQNTAQSRGVSWLPPYHDMGLVGGILQPLYVGAETTLMAPVAFLQRPMRWLEAIAHYRASTSGGPNFAYDLCLRKATPEQIQSLDLSCWALAFTGAEPIHQSTLDQFAATFAESGFRQEAFYPCYGMAETTLIVTGKAQGETAQSLPVSATDLQLNRVTVIDSVAAPPATASQSTAPGENPAAIRRIVGCGQSAIPDQVVIVDPDTALPCPEDGIGEIWVRWSPSISQGYWQREEATTQSFRATLANTGEGPFLRTGDLGFLHGAELYVTGRLKDLIIIRGRNHYPQDIEATVEQAHPALRQGAGAAFAIEGEGAEQLVIVQELERSALRKVDPEAVFTAIRRAVANHHDLQVGAIGLLKTNAMPKTSSGKIQRHLCRQGFLQADLPFVKIWQADAIEADGARGEGVTAEVIDAQAVQAMNAEAIDQGGPASPEIPTTGESPAASPEPDSGASPLPATMASVATSPLMERQTPAAIQRWMVNWLATALKVAPASLDVRLSFADYGLDSLTAVELAEALATTLGVSLSPTLVYEYPTIEALSVYLAESVNPEPPQTVDSHQASLDARELEQLVRELEKLSEADVQRMLFRQSR